MATHSSILAWGIPCTEEREGLIRHYVNQTWKKTLYRIPFIHHFLTYSRNPFLWIRVDLLEKTLLMGGMGAGGEGDDRGWDGWMAPPTQWTWVWVNSRSWWWTGRRGVLWFVGSQRVRHDWATELNWGPLRTWMTWRWTLSFELHCCLPMALTLYLVAGKTDAFWNS